MGLENTAEKLEGEEFVDELKTGTKLMLGQYTIEDFLAAGGFGITYLAKDSLDRRVVIKECFPGSFCRRQNTSVTPRSRAHQNELRSIVRLFSQEAMTLAKANHPNIVGVHQVFEENNTAYMALDYVQGRDLLEILQDDPGSLKPELVESYLTKVLKAIGHIHKLGMLHRDISPDNIIINDKDEPILIDFGAARESTNERVTRMLSALRVVKDGYSPQEFYIAGSEQSPSCDLYSLAASFYHLITGELPPDSQWRLSACAAGDEDPYVSLGEKTKDYSKRFVTGLDKAMSILPRDRMQSAEEWLEHLADGPAVAPVRPAKPAAAAAPAKKSSFMPALLGTTALAAAAGAAFFYMSNSETPAPASVAGTEEVAAAAPAVAPVAPTATEEDPIVAEPEGRMVSEAFVPADPVPQVPVAPAPAAIAAPDAGAEVAVIPEVQEVNGVAVSVAAPQPPAIVDATNVEIAPIAAIGVETGTAVERHLGLEAAMASFADTAPILLTEPPAAPEPSAPVIEARQEAPASAESGESGSTALDFFLSMAKPEPALSATATSRNSASTAVRPSRPAVAPAPSAAPSVDASSSIIARRVPVLPFTLSPWQPGLVIEVTEDAPAWLTRNARIVSVDGQAVATNAEIAERFQAAEVKDSETFARVNVGIDTGLGTAVTEQTMTVPTEKHTLLLNGLRFVTRDSGAGWTTEVTEVPDGSNFKVGDMLVAYGSQMEMLNGQNSLQNVLERELENGTSSFSFAVRRDGEIWLETFTLASLAN